MRNFRNWLCRETSSEQRSAVNLHAALCRGWNRNVTVVVPSTWRRTEPQNGLLLPDFRINPRSRAFTKNVFKFRGINPCFFHFNKQLTSSLISLNDELRKILKNGVGDCTSSANLWFTITCQRLNLSTN